MLRAPGLGLHSTASSPATNMDARWRDDTAVTAFRLSVAEKSMPRERTPDLGYFTNAVFPSQMAGRVMMIGTDATAFNSWRRSFRYD